MSKYNFGLGRGKIPPRRRAIADRIAARHGADLCNPTMPGEGPRYWFSAPNLGEPFDSAVAHAVAEDLERAGLDIHALGK